MVYVPMGFDFVRGAPYALGTVGPLPGGVTFGVTPQTALPVFTIEDLDAYFTTAFNGPAWAALTPEQKTLASTDAQRWLQGLCWDLSAICCGHDFESAYLQATAELALALYNNPTAMIPAAAAAATRGPIKRQKIDVLEVEFHPPADASAASDGRLSPRSPLLFQRFPWLIDLIGCWADYGGQQLIRMLRN